MVCTLSALREIQFGAGIFKIPRRINAFRGGRASGGSERAAIHGEQEIAKPVAAVLAFGRVRGFGKGRNRLRRLVARTNCPKRICTRACASATLARAAFLSDSSCKS